MNTNTNNTNNEENINSQTQGENNICESSTNINLNNNLTLEDYACIGSGYTKYNKYDISSYELTKIIEDSHPIRTSCFSPKGDCLAIGTNSRCLKIYSLSHVLSNFRKYTGYRRKSNYFHTICSNGRNNTKISFKKIKNRCFIPSRFSYTAKSLTNN